MNRPGRIVLSALAAALALAVVWPLGAAPIVPRTGAMPHEIQSLSGMERVQLTLLELPEPLTDLGLNSAKIRRICEERLSRQGVEVAESSKLPRLELWFKPVSDPTQPEMLCIITVISVYQPAHLPRLNRELNVPTACFISGTMRHGEEMVQPLLRDLATRFGNIARTIKRATAPTVSTH